MMNLVGRYCQSTLGQLIYIFTGKLDANAANDNGEFPFFTCAEKPLKIDKYEFELDAILLAGNGNFGVSHYSGKFNAYQRTYVITPIAGPSRYYYWLIKAKINEITASERGSTVKYIRKGDIENVTISLPPLAEQTRIAAKLDELLALVDTLKVRIDGIPAQLKRFRQSVLAIAVSGRLTEEWRCDHGVDSNWKKESIGSICSAAFDGPFGSKLKSNDYTTEGIRVVRLENIGHLSFIGEKKTFISFGKLEELAKNKLEVGDILFSSFVDEEIRVCQLPRGREIFINKADCFCLRINQAAADPIFVMYSLAARGTYRQIRESVHGATRPRINLGFLKGFEVSLPSPSEQTEIVRRVEQLFAFADQLETRVKTAQARIDRLTQSILAKAFRGDLVPQDPNDEPASVLLERIKAQRAAAPKAKRGRKASV